MEVGESFYRFLLRTVIGSLRSAWALEKARLARTGRGPWTPRNDILNAWALTVVLFGGLALAFGPVVLPFLLIQAVVGFCLLEVVNYLEHYGLLRGRREDGRFERTRPLLVAQYGGDVTRANIVPRRRAQILARHAAP